MKSRGMRDISTLQSRRNRAMPANRSEMVVQLARMEHERIRLERELDIWTGKQQAAEASMHQAKERIDALRDALYEGQAPAAEPCADTEQGTPVEEVSGAGDPLKPNAKRAKNCRVISLEY